MSKVTRPTAPTVGFISLGCPKNLVDSEVMMGLLDQAGARLTGRPEEAEILVVNTCSFIDTAKQESVDTILEMARHKTEGRAKKLIVTGCLVERYRNEIQKNIPEVDAVVGTGELESILDAAGMAPAAKPVSPFNILTGAAAARAGQESLAGTRQGDDIPRRGRCTRAAGAVHARGMARRGASASDVSLRREHPAAAFDRAHVGLRQDCRRLRPSMHLLRDPEFARKVSLAAV